MAHRQTPAENRASSRLALREIGPMDSRNSGTPVRVNVPDSMLTPSPDEMIIRQRGRRQPATVSSEVQCQQLLSLLHSPTKHSTPTKSSPRKGGSYSCPTRGSPRKRLSLPDSPCSSPLGSHSTSLLNSPSKSKVRVNCQLVKRQRIQRQPPPPEDLSLALKGLSHGQLIDIISQIVQVHSDLKEEIVAGMPLPDIRPLEERLVYLRCNISSAFPRTRLVSRGDAFCYHRVATHLTAFKKVCLEQSRCLLGSQQWSSAVDYILLAWSYVSHLPDFECLSHNKVKQQCFVTLASHCMTALKSGAYHVDHLEEIGDRLREAEACSTEIGPCRRFAENLLVAAKEQCEDTTGQSF